MGLVIAVAAVALALLVGLVAFTALVARAAERRVPPCGRHVTVDGVRLHVLDVGRGPTIVMLHGLAAQLQTFTYALSGLLEDRYRLVMIDRPGCGYSDAASNARLDAQAACVAGVMRALDLKPSLVVGHSLGGAVALALALDHPDLVAGLALLAPATRAQTDVPAALSALAIRSDLMRWLVGWTVALPMALRHRHAIESLLFGADPVVENFAMGAGAVLGARPATFRNGCRDLVEAGGDLARIEAFYGRLTMPVGVLYGEQDRILDPMRHGRGLEGLVPNLHLEWISGGHMIPLSAPARTAAFIDTMAARAGFS